MNRLKRWSWTVAAVGAGLGGLVLPGAAHADILPVAAWRMPAFSGYTPASTTPSLVGARFEVDEDLNEDLYVTALGTGEPSIWPDPGLPVPITMGLFDDSGVLLASVTIPAGDEAPLEDEFRFVDITPVKLEAGAAYRIAAFRPAGSYSTLAGGYYVSDPRITHTHIYNNGNPSGLAFPRFNAISGYSNAALNFKISAVPEPAAGGVLVLGGLAVMARRRGGRRM